MKSISIDEHQVEKSMLVMPMTNLKYHRRHVMLMQRLLFATNKHERLEQMDSFFSPTVVCFFRWRLADRTCNKSGSSTISINSSYKDNWAHKRTESSTNIFVIGGNVIETNRTGVGCFSSHKPKENQNRTKRLILRIHRSHWWCGSNTRRSALKTTLVLQSRCNFCWLQTK